MPSNYLSDIEKLILLHSDDVAQKESLFQGLLSCCHLLEAELGGDTAHYVLTRAFKSLSNAVKVQKFHQKETLESLFERIARNIAFAEPIRTEQQPECDRLLKSLYTSIKIRNTVRSLASSQPHLDYKTIVKDALYLLYLSVTEGKYGGRCSLETFFIGICKKLVLKEGNNNQRVMLIDNFLFFDTADENGADVHVKTQEMSENERLRDNILRGLLKNGALSQDCVDIFEMQYEQSLSMEKIAQRQGIAVQSAKNKALRCREKLRTIIKENPLLSNFFKNSY